jgi:hypothetical protein
MFKITFINCQKYSIKTGLLLHHVIVLLVLVLYLKKKMFAVYASQDVFFFNLHYIIINVCNNANVYASQDVFLLFFFFNLQVAVILQITCTYMKSYLSDRTSALGD